MLEEIKLKFDCVRYCLDISWLGSKRLLKKLSIFATGPRLDNLFFLFLLDRRLF
jgi:hypothetical protein